jgi:hypothetical protein
MNSLYFRSIEPLTAARCFTFFILLLCSIIFAHTATSYRTITLPILTILQLALEHLLEIVQPNALGTFKRHLSMLLLTILLYGAWLFDAAVSTRCKNYETLSGNCSSQIWQWWSSTGTVLGKAELVSEWTIVVAYIIHNTIGVMQAIEARLYRRLLKENGMGVDEKVLQENSETVGAG